MTPNDKQMDLLMRHAARKPTGVMPIEHLDVDEINAFAEGRLPSAARAHYVSHLANCDRCRRQVAQLAISGGAVAREEPGIVETMGSQNVWRTLASIFSGRTLRYAAFAAVVLVAAGIAFIALRRTQRPTEMVASSETAEQHPPSAANPQSSSSANNEPQSNGLFGRQSSPQPQTPRANEEPKRDEATVAAGTAVDAQPAKELAAAPKPEEKKTTEADVTRVQPSYAPAPPGEAQSRQQKSVAGLYSTEQRQADQPTDKLAPTARNSAGSLKDARDDAKRGEAANVTSAARRAPDEKSKGGPSRNLETANRAANEVRNQPMTLRANAEDRKSEEETGQRRSVGGHKFRKQGGAWVDEKLKASMTVKAVSRGSDEFNSLDSGLRALAQQVGGEVLLVWKGKAYLIK